LQLSCGRAALPCTHGAIGRYSVVRDCTNFQWGGLAPEQMQSNRAGCESDFDKHDGT
jgi:hypothetical protein